MLSSLKMELLGSFEQIKSDFFVSDEIYTQPEFLEAAKKTAKNSLLNYFNEFRISKGLNSNHPSLEIVHSLQQKFNIPARELETDPIIQEQAQKTMLNVLGVGLLGCFEQIKSDFFVSDEIYTQPEFLEAAKKAITLKIRNCINDRNSSSKDLQDVWDIKKRFGIDEQSFEEISRVLILNSLKSGNVEDIIIIQKIFLIPDDELLSSKYVTLAEQALDINFKIGNKNNIEKIKKKFLPNLDITEFIKNKYLNCINERKWDLVIKLKTHFLECEFIFQKFFTKQKEIAKNNKLPFTERQKAFDILADLAKNGETSINQEFSDIILTRAKQKEVPDSKWGLDLLQESAFYTLMRLNNPNSNQSLFNLLFNENVNTTIKYAVLRKLLKRDNFFLDSHFKENLHTWFYSTFSQETDWRDLKFIEEIQKIPSKELRDISLKSFSILKAHDHSIFPLYKTWKEKYSNIPQNVFLQILELNNACESKGLLDKFQILFTNIRRENSKKDNLLYGITNVLKTDPQILKLLGKKLETIDFNSKQDADSLSELLRWIIFLDRIENIKKYHINEDHHEQDEDEDYEKQPQKTLLSSKITEIFSKETKDFNDLTILIKEAATKKFQEILPNKNITAEKIDMIEKEWGDLEPLFTYLGRYPQLKEYIAEIVANISTPENWKNWRYNLKRGGAKNQIGHLSKEQLEIWKNNYFSEIGDIIIAEIGSEKPEQIQHILQDAILQHRHIFNPEMDQNKNEFIHKALKKVFEELSQTPDKQTEIIEREIELILSAANNIDAIIHFNNLPQIRQTIESIFIPGTEITPSSKIKDSIGFISVYLPVDIKKVLRSNYLRMENQKKIVVDDLFTPEMRQIIEQKTQEIEKNYQGVLSSNIWEKIQLDKDNLKNPELLYSKRQELQSTIDLLRLLNLSNKIIATNKISEKEGKKGGETIINILERLKKYFKDSPLLQDINNVEFILKEKVDFGEKRRLAIIFTDNPQILWQAGKYPFGSGSCQHYADGTHAKQLMGYVGDPNCKVAYLIDLNKLPEKIREEIEKDGFEKIKDNIPNQELLNASLARVIIKMAKDQKGKPVILLEPIYPEIYRKDVSINRYFNIFIDLMVAEPIGAKIARDGGNDSITKGQSLSPEGQYEDSNLNKVKFIPKLSKPTEEEIKVIERISSSR